MGDEGFAFPGWSFRFGGVEKFPFIKKIARTATIEHVFNGKQTKSWKNEDLQTSKYTSSFSPLAGISLSTKGGVTLSSRYAIVSTIDNRDAKYAGNILASSNKNIHIKIQSLLKPIA